MSNKEELFTVIDSENLLKIRAGRISRFKPFGPRRTYPVPLLIDGSQLSYAMGPDTTVSVGDEPPP